MLGKVLERPQIVASTGRFPLSVRVLLVGPYPRDTGRVAGGVQTSFVNLVAGLAALDGLEAEVVTFTKPPDPPSVTTTVGGVPVFRVRGSGRFGYLTRHAREKEALRTLIRERHPDVVHAQTSLVPGYASLKASGTTPVVVQVHGIIAEEIRHLPPGREWLRAKVFAVGVQRYCMANARFFISATPYAEQYFDGVIRGRVWDVANPIGDEFFAVAPRPEPGRILFMGRIVPLKRLLDLVEALPRVLEKVPVAHLRIAGPTDAGSYEQAVRKRVAELELAHAVEFLGNLQGEARIAEYASAAVLALPSGQEASPLVVGEAMAAGLPVVATRVGGLSYLVEPGRCGHIVDVGDVDALAERLAEVVGNAGVQHALGTGARAKAEREFRIPAVAKRVRGIYEEVRELAL
jgi:glycosyltransferase involved in cell wall biosynthesis